MVASICDAFLDLALTFTADAQAAANVVLLTLGSKL